MIHEQIALKPQKSKYAEIQDLVNRSTFRAVLRTELPDGENPGNSKIGQCHKVRRRQRRTIKATYVAGELLGMMKDYLVHGAQTIQHLSVHIILVVANIKGIHIWVVDVKPAYSCLISL